LPNFALVAFVVFYGLDWVATVPPTIALATRKFGIGQAALVYGWIFAAHQLGAATEASVAGLLRTSEGDSFLAFTGAGYLSLVAAGLVLGIGGRSFRRRTQPVALAPARSD